MLKSSSIKKGAKMPNIKSAKKRVSVIARRKEENKYVKSTMSTMIKNFRTVVSSDAKKAESLLDDIVSYINSAKSKGIIHKNNASRKVARLNILLNKAKSGKPTAVVAEKVEVAVEETQPAEKESSPKPAKKAEKKAEKVEKKEEKPEEPKTKPAKKPSAKKPVKAE
jgi:small subunit ribosomal protein S20